MSNIKTFFSKLFGAVILSMFLVTGVIELLSHILGTPSYNALSESTQKGLAALVVLFWLIFFFTQFLERLFRPRSQNILELKKLDIDSMTGAEFENFCARLLAYNGFSQIRTTPSSSDHGIDILAKKDGNLYAIQCKRYDKSVGNKAIQEAYSGKTIYKADYPVVMTNSHFTKQAIHDASTLNVILWDRSVIKKYLSI